MRLRCKYKGYNNLSHPFERFPLRILKFKNTKWKRIQKQFSNSSIMDRSFVDTFFTKVPYKTWDKLNNYYRDGNRLKNTIVNLFDKSFSPSYFKKILKNSSLSSTIREMYLYTLVKPEFRVDILLWKLDFFSSSYQGRQALNEKKVLVNNKHVGANYFLSKGDIISFTDKFNIKLLNIKENKNKFLPTDMISTFVEVDYYSNTIVIIKDLQDLTIDDFYLIIKDSYNLKQIKDYI